MIFVSHNRYAIEDVCNQVLYLKNGKPVQMGHKQDVINRYLTDIKDEELEADKKSPNGLPMEDISS